MPNSEVIMTSFTITNTTLTPVRIEVFLEFLPLIFFILEPGDTSPLLPMDSRSYGELRFYATNLTTHKRYDVECPEALFYSPTSGETELEITLYEYEEYYLMVASSFPPVDGFMFGNTLSEPSTLRIYSSRSDAIIFTSDPIIDDLAVNLNTKLKDDVDVLKISVLLHDGMEVSSVTPVMFIRDISRSGLYVLESTDRETRTGLTRLS